MNSRAGSGEYPSTSTAPSRPASDVIAAASASGSRMSAAAPAAVIPSPSSSAASAVQLRLRARHEPDGEPLAAEAPGDGHAEVRPGPDDHDRHAPEPSRAASGRMPRMEEGKRVSWVELYLDLVFVLAVAQIAHLIVAEPEMHSVWIALGLFFTLWWTWVGFAVLYNRYGADERRQRVLFLAASIPAGVAAVAIEPASVGDSTVFALSLAATRIVIATAHGLADEKPLTRQITRACVLSAALFLVSIWVPEPFRYVLWAIAIFTESGAMLNEDRRGGAPGEARALVRGVPAERPGRGAGSAPLRRAVRPVPDHPARRGRRRGGAGVGRRPRRLRVGLVRAGRGDGARRRAVVAVLRLRGRAQPQGARAVGRLAHDGPRDLRGRAHAPVVRAAAHRGRRRAPARGGPAVDRVRARVHRRRDLPRGHAGVPATARAGSPGRSARSCSSRRSSSRGSSRCCRRTSTCGCSRVWIGACAALTTSVSSDEEIERLMTPRAGGRLTPGGRPPPGVDRGRCVSPGPRGRAP